jgi:hypothetical protein
VIGCQALQLPRGWSDRDRKKKKRWNLRLCNNQRTTPLRSTWTAQLQTCSDSCYCVVPLVPAVVADRCNVGENDYCFKIAGSRLTHHPLAFFVFLPSVKSMPTRYIQLVSSFGRISGSRTRSSPVLHMAILALTRIHLRGSELCR